MRIIHRSFFSSTLLTVILSTILLSGCGQTGPLYLPDDSRDNAQGKATESVDEPALRKPEQDSNDEKAPDLNTK